MIKKEKILVTGAGGFIGYSLCKKLLMSKNNEVIGLDNLNSYYSIKIKKRENKRIKLFKKFSIFKLDLFEKKN